jgi:hypothetical protein
MLFTRSQGWVYSSPFFKEPGMAEPYPGHNERTPEQHVQYLVENPAIFGFTDEEQKALTLVLKELRGLRKLAYERWEIANARISQLEAQLPEGMKLSIIRFKECEKGHGRLLADNWVDGGCPYCRIDSLKQDVEKLNDDPGTD